LCADHAALDQDVAVQLCCLEIRYFFKDMPQIALDKKSNLEYLEREVKNTVKWKGCYFVNTA
jgi:focal adhesion kinase 1